MNDKKSPEDIWQFPCTHPIKIMGPAKDSLLPLSISIIQKHVPEFQEGEIRSTLSKTGKYLSLTIDVEFHSKAQIDSLFAELAHHQQNGDDISFVI